MSRRPVAVLGATGVAGARALTALADHPWFEVTTVACSSAHAGRRLGDVLAERGRASDGLAAAELVLADAGKVVPEGVDLVFSLLPADVAEPIEARCAATVPVVSTSAAFRNEPDTPLLLAGVNGSHAELLERQRERRGWRGFVAPTPNCTTVGLAVTLAPLMTRFGVTAVTLTSMQAISGAGSRAVVVADAVAGNVLPFILQEEQKVESELRKILGRVDGGVTHPADFPVSATCTRVPVEDGHTLVVCVGLGSAAGPEDVMQAFSAWNPWVGRSLPSLPERWIEVRGEIDRPQPRLDRDAGGGFTTVVGRVRHDAVGGGVKYIAVTHNTVLGAAGGAVLLAEDLADRGML